MSDGNSYADLILLALIAGFILLRLRSVLGDKIGNDSPSYFSKPTPVADKPEPVVQLSDKTLVAKMRDDADTYMTTQTNSDIVEGINAIKAKDAQFTATRFLAGAKGAFEMVFDAFNKGDKQTLKMLMSDSLLQEFSNVITDREAQDTMPETTLVSVLPKDITRASLNNNVAQITVLFVSEQVSVIRNKNGEIVGGDASEIRHAEDHWVFERDVASKNPNWKIIET